MKSEFSLAKKRAGAYFNDSETYRFTCQESADSACPVLREAIRMSRDFFQQTYKQLREEAEKGNGDKNERE